MQPPGTTLNELKIVDDVGRTNWLIYNLKRLKNEAIECILDDYKETTATGGGVSLAVFGVIIILVLSEVIYYARTELKFDYEVDTQMDGKLKINIDITVAMRCNALGADVVDSTGQNFGHQNFGSLEMDDTYFELSTEQRRYLDIIQDVNKYLREEYHAIQELMWLSGSVYTSFRKGMPESDEFMNPLPKWEESYIALLHVCPTNPPSVCSPMSDQYQYSQVAMLIFQFNIGIMIIIYSSILYKLYPQKLEPTELMLIPTSMQLLKGLDEKLSGFLADIICCRFQGKYKESDSSSSSSQILTQSLTDDSSFNKFNAVNLLQSGT
ncbi:ERGIC2 [Mytilus edulis]|uniref:ERGIC2 n=1 Tax=Mytilus edulis TaxID=6550 RepID=A0A8S3RPF8_MYTED|nr:ERGIC2 [Mytilus edulis]